MRRKCDAACYEGQALQGRGTRRKEEERWEDELDKKKDETRIPPTVVTINSLLKASASERPFGAPRKANLGPTPTKERDETGIRGKHRRERRRKQRSAEHTERADRGGHKQRPESMRRQERSESCWLLSANRRRLTRNPRQKSDIFLPDHEHVARAALRRMVITPDSLFQCCKRQRRPLAVV